MADAFLHFMQQRAARRDETPPFDREARLEAWLEELNKLYKLVERSLCSHVEAGDVTVQRGPFSVTEPRMGTYDAQRLVLRFDDDQLVAEPVGTLLIGCRGRVDLAGPQGNVRLVLLDKGGPAFRSTISEGGPPIETSTSSAIRGDVDRAGWYIATRPPGITVTPLTEESFRDLVMDLLGG